MVCSGMGGWSAIRERTRFFPAFVQFKDTHLRAPKTPFLACGVQCYGWLERQPTTPMIFCCIAQLKDPHPRYPKTRFLACGVQCYGCLKRRPRTHNPQPPQYFVAVCRSKTPILGIQKHLFLRVVCSGMDGRGATPEPTRYFVALCSSKTPI